MSSTYLKSRVEKKIVNRYLSACQGCGRDHTKETRLESSRRRRVASEMRRVRRRAYRQSPLSQWLHKEFTIQFQATLYEEAMKELFGSTEMIKTGLMAAEDFNWDAFSVPAPGVELSFVKAAWTPAEAALWLKDWTEGDDTT